MHLRYKKSEYLDLHFEILSFRIYLRKKKIIYVKNLYITVYEQLSKNERKKGKEKTNSLAILYFYIYSTWPFFGLLGAKFEKTTTTTG